MELLFQLLLVVLLILINAYFVASELALVSIRRTRIDELVRKGDKSAKIVQNSLKNIDQFISATQLGVTLISLLLGWLGEPIMAHAIQNLFSLLPKPLATIASHTIAVICGFILITFIDIVFGELVPKNIALQKPERISFITITPLIIFAKIFHPFIRLLTGSSNVILKLLGFSQTANKQLTHTEDEIKIILSQSAQSGEIEKEEAEMVNNVFRLADMPVKHIMVPREKIIGFSEDILLRDLITEIQKTTFSRFPIYKKSIDTVTGFVHVKDVYKLALPMKDNKQLRNTTIIREIIRIPETKRVDDVIIEMRNKRLHLALVANKIGKTTGIVTLEDLLESVVGDIKDEFEKPGK